jgi:serine/threonine protein phosphatase 1
MEHHIERSAPISRMDSIQGEGAMRQTARRVTLFGYTKPVATAVLRFQSNTCGRDFVVGDLHGMYDALYGAMHAVGFVPGMDRLFCVGDLVDFGAASARCMEILNIPGVHTVRGYREQRILSLYGGGAVDEEEALFHQYHDGGAWWARLRNYERQHILERFGQLPWAIEVQTEKGMVGIVHADVPRALAWDTFTDKLQQGERLMQFTAIAGTASAHAQDEAEVQGLWRLYVGHAVQQGGARQLGNVMMVDTGAVVASRPAGGAGYGLTFMELTGEPEPIPVVQHSVQERRQGQG